MFKSVEFSSSSQGYKLIIKEFKRRVFGSLSTKSLDYFLRGQDIISIDPIVNGEHEPELTELIAHFNKIGYRDFLIDIGANIGLTSCQNGLFFKRVFCFEPNPLCVHILKVNTEIALSNNSFEINEFGLGKSDAELDLWIPKHNWGGAFVKSNDNSYTDELLASKDGFSEIDKTNYFIKKIQIRSCKDVLEEKFSSLLNNGFNNGVIKIDVEGMEEVVLKGISQSIPDNFKVMIVFENWNPNFNVNEINEYFSKFQTSFFMLSRKNPYETWTKLIKRLALLFGKSKLLLIPLETSERNVGDVVIQIGSLVE